MCGIIGVQYTAPGGSVKNKQLWVSTLYFDFQAVQLFYIDVCGSAMQQITQSTKLNNHHNIIAA